MTFSWNALPGCCCFVRGVRRLAGREMGTWGAPFCGGTLVVSPEPRLGSETFGDTGSMGTLVVSPEPRLGSETGAGVACGLRGDHQSSCRLMIKDLSSISPNSSNAGINKQTKEANKPQQNASSRALPQSVHGRPPHSLVSHGQCRMHPSSLPWQQNPQTLLPTVYQTHQPMQSYASCGDTCMTILKAVSALPPNTACIVD